MSDDRLDVRITLRPSAAERDLHRASNALVRHFAERRAEHRRRRRFLWVLLAVDLVVLALIVYALTS